MAWTKFMMDMFGVAFRIINIHNELGLSFKKSTWVVISNALTILVSIIYEMVEFAKIPSGLTLHMLWIKSHHMDLRLNPRFVIPLPFVAIFVMQRLYTFIPHHSICFMHISIYMCMTTMCPLKCVVSL
jgi:hypothetical protein